MNTEEQNLAERIRACAKLVGGEGVLAEKTGIPPRTLQEYLTGKSEPKASRLVAIADAAQVSLAWLVSGKGPMQEVEYARGGRTVLRTGDGRPVAFQVDSSEHPMAAALSGAPNVKVLKAPYDLVAGAIPVIGEIDVGSEPKSRHDRGWSDGEYAYIPLFDVKAGAGHGKYPIGERIIAWPVFMLSFVRNVLKAEPDDLGMATSEGLSMYPDIADGAGMLLNFKRIGQPIEGVYLLRVGDGLIVKNAQQMVDGNLRVFSSNPDGKYRDMVITPDDVADGRAAIIAKVVWADRLF